jgi:hypothetical protein
MTTVGRTFLSIVAACAVSAALAGPAAATLVPGELRFGPTTADPLVPLFDAASPLQTSLGLRELPGGAPKIEFTSTSPNPPALSCDPLPADEVYSAAELTTNGPVAGQQLYVTADDCQSAFVSGRIELNVYGDPLRSFAMRAEANRTGGRDGVLEPQPGQPFRVKLDFFNPGQTQPYGGCVFSIYSRGKPTRIDVYNPGHGHKIDFEHEPLTYLSGNSICNSVTLHFSAEVRLRGYDSQATGPNHWTKPVWLLPAVQTTVRAG